MRASAPGKVVLSGAYAVLHGAPAIVAAVSRRAHADASQAAQFEPSEVQYAVKTELLPRVPLVDASELRDGNKKLGLGSSAALLVASLATSERYDLSSDAGRQRLFADALAIHRTVQQGGSGIDVAASTFGGTSSFKLSDNAAPQIRPLALPSALHIEVWASHSESSTKQALQRVAAARRSNPGKVNELLAELTRSSTAAVEACTKPSAQGFLDALAAQHELFVRLGKVATVPICTDNVQQLHRLAQQGGAVVLPAGAGGGDVAYYAGFHPPGDSLLRQLPGWGHRQLALKLDASGACRLAAHR